MEDAEQPLFVPVHRSTVGTVTPLTARLPQGPRVGIAFTSLQALVADLSRTAQVRNVPTPSPTPSPVPSSATAQAVSR